MRSHNKMRKSAHTFCPK